MNTMPQLWGDDAAEFKPERWLDRSDDKVPGGSMYSTQTFLHGPHQCIGNRMAELEMKAMTTILLANYELELAKKDQVRNRQIGRAHV